jgi:hypothetical protein
VGAGATPERFANIGRDPSERRGPPHPQPSSFRSRGNVLPAGFRSRMPVHAPDRGQNLSKALKLAAIRFDTARD